MKKILVTGATGFIGNYVIKELLQNGHEVIATSRSLKKARELDWFDQVSYIPFDFNDVESIEDLYTFFKSPAILIHLAWEGLPNYRSAHHITENLPRHYSFIKNIVKYGLKDMSIIGTCFEYGMQEGCLAEYLPDLPANSYAEAKSRLRILVAELAAKADVSMKWIRLFYTYGKGQNPNSLFSQLQAALDKGEEVFNMSPGDQLRDFLPVEKMAECIVKISLQQKQTGVINCCSGMPVSVKEMVLQYLKQRNGQITLNTGFYPYPDTEPRNFWGDVSKLEDILNIGKSSEQIQ